MSAPWNYMESILPWTHGHRAKPQADRSRHGSAGARPELFSA